VNIYELRTLVPSSVVMMYGSTMRLSSSFSLGWFFSVLSIGAELLTTIVTRQSVLEKPSVTVKRNCTTAEVVRDTPTILMHGTMYSAPPATTPPPAPAPSGEPSAPPIQAQVLLALRWGEQGVEIAQLLETRGERALFLFACDELAAQGDAVRRLAAAGHTVGLALTGEDAETCAAQLKEGRRLLAEIARYHAVVVSADALEAGDREALAQEGCALWNRDLRGEDYRSGTDLVEALSPQRGNFVELSCGAGSAAFLRGMFSAMEAESCYLRQVTAPLLG